MTRPLYESEKDRANEEKVAEELADRFKCTFLKLPIKYIVDYAFVRDDKVVGLIEVRCRNVKYETYDTIMLSVHKRIDCLNLAKALGVPCLFAVKYEDGLYTIDLSEEPDFSGIGGRNKPRDWQDTEIVFHYKKERLIQWS